MVGRCGREASATPEREISLWRCQNLPIQLKTLRVKVFIRLSTNSVSWFELWFNALLGLILAESLITGTKSVTVLSWAPSYCVLCCGVEHLGLHPP